MRAPSATLAMTVLALACGGREPGTTGDGGGQPDGGGGAAYLPLAIGATWTYRATDMSSGAVTEKVSIVEALEDVGGRKAGVMAFRIRTEESGEATVSWQEHTSTAVVRHREDSYGVGGVKKLVEWYEPSKLRVDESAAHTVKGATWTDTYTEIGMPSAGGTTTTPKSEVWTVEAVDEMTTVPAGTFPALRVKRGGKSSKTYWFARGVGKIRESGGRLEELTKVMLP